MTEKHILQWTDYLVIAIMLCISIGIGIYYRFSGGRQKTMEVCKLPTFFEKKPKQQHYI